MRRLRFCLLIAIFALRVAPAAAQDRDARVALPGQLRIDLGANYLRADSRFGLEGSSDPWGLDGRLDASRFLPLQEPAAALDDFLALTGGDAASIAGSDLSAGELDFDAVVAVRHLPIRLGLGIFDRLEVGASIPILLTQRLVRRFEIAAGNVGLNPDVEGNTAILSVVGPIGEALGGAALLPVSGTAVAHELQAHVGAATGGTLSLPLSALTKEELAASFQFSQPIYDPAVWETGDVEIDARFQLLRSFAGAFPDSAGGLDYRMTLSGSYRFPVEVAATAASEADPNPLKGYRGAGGGVSGDIFFGERFWLSAGGMVRRLSREAIATPDEGDQLPGESLRLDDLGNSAELWAQPRVRMTRELSIGASFQLERRDGGSVDGSWTSAGITLRYSNLPSFDGAEAGYPLDAAIGFTSPFGGPSGAVRTSRVFVQLSIQPRLWGGSPTVVDEAPSSDGGDAAPFVE